MSSSSEGRAVEVMSFGYLRGGPPSNTVVEVDVRTHFYDPHHDPSTRQLTAHDGWVRDKVLATPGIPTLIDGLVAVATAYASTPTSAPVLIAVGCAGGRHRSATIANEVASRLQAAGILATVTHRDIDLGVIDRPAVGAAT
jgi:RNase adaptor protein for sRNA GlmZ degradation